MKTVQSIAHKCFHHIPADICIMEHRIMILLAIYQLNQPRASGTSSHGAVSDTRMGCFFLEIGLEYDCNINRQPEEMAHVVS